MAMIEKDRQGQCLIRGVIDYDSVVSLRHLGDQWIMQSKTPTMDFQYAHCLDSSGLALMIAWLRCAKRQKKRIH